MEHIFTEENRFLKCPCGARQSISKMQSVNNALVCQKCARIAEAKQRRQERNAEQYQVIVSLLDGSRLYFCKEVAQ